MREKSGRLFCKRTNVSAFCGLAVVRPNTLSILIFQFMVLLSGMNLPDGSCADHTISKQLSFTVCLLSLLEGKHLHFILRYFSCRSRYADVLRIVWLQHGKRAVEQAASFILQLWIVMMRAYWEKTHRPKKDTTQNPFSCPNAFLSRFPSSSRWYCQNFVLWLSWTSGSKQ